MRPELDRIGELVITEAGDSPRRRAGPSGFHLIPSWLTTDSISLTLANSTVSAYAFNLTTFHPPPPPPHHSSLLPPSNPRNPFSSIRNATTRHYPPPFPPLRPPPFPLCPPLYHHRQAAMKSSPRAYAIET